MIKEASLADLEMMFKSTLIRQKDEPVFIESLSQNNGITKAELYYLSNGDCKWVVFDEDNYNFKPVRLGYVNLRGFAIYLYRRPLRRYKQGLHYECLGQVPNRRNDWSQNENIRLMECQKLVQKLHNKELVNTIKGYYPSLSDALAMFEDMACEVAFDRQFSIDKMNKIRYKGNVVGGYSTKQKQIVFNDGFEYLNKALRKNYEI